MAAIILVLMAGLTALAVAKRREPALFGAILGVLTFLVTPLYSFGDFPLRLLREGAPNMVGLIVSAALAVILYGGIGALMSWYLRSSIDVRAVRILFSCIFAAAISGMAYLAVNMLIVREGSTTAAATGIALATGAFVGLVTSFALTHGRPADCAFFSSRDGAVVISALAGAVATAGTLSVLSIVVGVLARQPPGFFGMRGIILNLLGGGLLGAGLVVPLRGIESGRLVRGLIGAVIGCLALAAAFRGVGGAPVAGLATGALVGALLPLDVCEDAADEPARESPVHFGDEDPGFGQ